MRRLEVLEPLERDAVDVAARDVARGREAVRVVVDVEPQDGHHLEHVLAWAAKRGRRRVRARTPSRARASADRRRRAATGAAFKAGAVRRAATTFSIFSVAITAAAS